MSSGSYIKNKGGRPKIADPKTKRLIVACTPDEQKIIVSKARAANLSVSEYLRTWGVNGHIDIKQRHIPKDVLALTRTLINIASNVNQLAKLNNAEQNFTVAQRENFGNLAMILFETSEQIKAYIQ